MEIKPKTNKWNLIKLNSFYTAEETLNNVKRQNSEWEKIITNETTDKQFIPRIYSQLIQHNTRKTKTNNPIKKWSKDLNGHFSKKDISSVQLCPALCDPMDCSTPGFCVLHHLLELA